MKLISALFSSVLSVSIVSSALGSLITVGPGGKYDYVYIQDAIYNASNGDEVIVAPGTYYANTEDGSWLNEVVNTQGKSIWLHSSHGSDVTFINGGGQKCGIRCSKKENANTQIEGFTIENCKADGGGGMYLDHTSPTVIDCVFLGNRSVDKYVYSANGGAIYINGGAPAIDSCAFINNYAQGGGGAIYCKNFSDTIITNCTFNSNYSMKGGAISNTSSSHMAISLCSFVGNNATFYGGSIYHLDSQNMTISDCSFTANFASSGGVTSRGGAIYLQSAAIDISQSTFSSNVSDLAGGGVATMNGQAMISGSEFSENSAVVGGAISFSNGTSQTHQIGSTLFCGNESNDVSGGWTDLGGNEFFDTCDIGACCTNDICVLIDQSTCTFVGGEFQGEDFACGDVECSESSCLGDLDGDGEVRVNDVLILLSGWGVCP